MNKKTIGIVAAAGIAAVLLVAAILLSGGREAVPPEDVPAASLPDRGAAVVSPHVEVPAPIQAAGIVPPVESPTHVMAEVQGAVVSPGVYSFPAGARVFDALEKAGGTLENAEIRDVNIAATLLDGSVLSIPYRQQDGRVPLPGASDLNPPAYTRSGWSEGPGEPAATAARGVAPSAPSKINLNTATQTELETLPGVGEKTAEKIIHFRETQPFTQVDDLRYIQGIGDKRMETLRPHVTVE